MAPVAARVEAEVGTQRRSWAPQWRTWRLLIFVGLAVISAGLRLVNLGVVPPFVDEDGYSTFAQNMSTITWKEVVLEPVILLKVTGDKPPLAILLQAWLNPAVGDVLIAGRLLSAFAGVATTILCYLLGRKLGGNSVGLVSMAAYALSPLAVLHERMVLQDPLMSVFSLAAILVAGAAIDRGSIRLAAAAAILGAVSVQMKVSGLVTAPLLLVLVAARGRDSRNYWYVAAIGAGGVVLSYIALLLIPGSTGIQEQNQKLLVPLGSVGANLSVLWDAIVTYLPFGLPVVAVIGGVVSMRANRRIGLVYVVALIVWAAPWVVLSRFAPSRYYLSADPYVCALIGLGSVWLVCKAARLNLASGAAVGCVGLVVYAASALDSVRLATDFVGAQLSTLDDCQYRSCWPSGYPYRAAHAFVLALPSGTSVAYMVDRDHRIALGLDQPSPPGIHSYGVVSPDVLLPIDSAQPLYVLVDDARDTPPGNGLAKLLGQYPQFKLVAQFLRPGSTGGVSVVSAS